MVRIVGETGQLAREPIRLIRSGDERLRALIWQQQVHARQRAVGLAMTRPRLARYPCGARAKGMSNPLALTVAENSETPPSELSRLRRYVAWCLRADGASQVDLVARGQQLGHHVTMLP